MNELITLGHVENEQDRLVNQIIETRGENLPGTIEDVKRVFEYTDLKAKAWKVMVDRMQKIDEQSEAYQSALRSGQQWAVSALYCQKKIGEMTAAIPRNSKSFGGSAPSGSEPTKTEVLENAGIDSRHVSDAERIAAHPDILDRVIENTVARGEIPTKTAVLNTIRVEEMNQRAKESKERSDKRVDNERPQAVADYYEAIKGFRAALELAMIAARNGKFAPEGKNFLVKKNDEIRSLLIELENLI